MSNPKAWFMAATLAVATAVVASPGASADRLEEADIFIELNATDGDAGIHLFLDAEGWERMQVLDPSGKVIFDVSTKGSLRTQGITELFFESAEPSFDEQPLSEFLELFPAGTYRFRGRTTEGEPLRGSAVLTHTLPAAPVLVSPGDGADDVDPEATVIRWNPVPNPPGSAIVGYQVVVEREEPELEVFKAEVGPETTQVMVPAGLLQPGTEYSFEVLAIERSGNRTISEAEFETAGD
jgi:hypothetical protein